METVVFIAFSFTAGFLIGYWFCHRGQKAALDKMSQSINRLNK